MTHRDKYTNFYTDDDGHVECDFCGQLTRGRVYDDEPNLVYCGSCHGLLRLVDDEVVKPK